MFLQALRVVWLQVGVTGIFSLVVWFLSGQDQALSSFWGGACAFIPALSYQVRAQLGGSGSARDALKAQYAGESFKFVVSIVMFYLVFTNLKTLDAPIFFATYVAALMCYFVALLTDKVNSQDRKDS
jgi:F0F1-type ATP synthase assembly protein I